MAHLSHGRNAAATAPPRRRPPVYRRVPAHDLQLDKGLKLVWRAEAAPVEVIVQRIARSFVLSVATILCNSARRPDIDLNPKHFEQSPRDGQLDIVERAQQIDDPLFNAAVD